MTYDPSNVFARILRGEIPCKKAGENDVALAFHDINPLAPVHILVIPKGAYVSSDDFFGTASHGEIVGLFQLAGALAREHGVAETGYRLMANHGAHARQEVPHFHLHIVGGRDLGRMLPKPT